MHLFGSGLLWATPTQNAVGAAMANPTPLLIGTMQECEVEFKRDLKTLYGQLTFPVDIAGGKGTITGKTKAASITGGMLEQIFFGQAGSAGIYAAMNDTAGAAIPAASPYTVTPTVPGAGTWAGDLGVIDVATGKPLVRVGAAPSTGQYAVTDGIYTFAAADASKTAYINFRYTGTSTVARKGSVTNLPMGQAPAFRTDLYVPHGGGFLIYTFYKCVSDGFKMGTKSDDYMIPDFGFQCFADQANRVMDWGTSE